MYKLRAGIAGFVTLLVLTPGVVHAKPKNYCISGFPNSAYIPEGQGFSVPGKGKCKAFIGFNQEGNFPVTGSGCTSSDGSNLSLTITTGSEADGFAETDTISLSLPAQTGAVVGQILDDSAEASFGPSDVTGGTCSGVAIPAVTQGAAASSRRGDGR
jgi:hypothetical protein